MNEMNEQIKNELEIIKESVLRVVPASDNRLCYKKVGTNCVRPLSLNFALFLSRRTQFYNNIIYILLFTPKKAVEYAETIKVFVLSKINE